MYFIGYFYYFHFLSFSFISLISSILIFLYCCITLLGFRYCCIGHWFLSFFIASYVIATITPLPDYFCDIFISIYWHCIYYFISQPIRYYFHWYHWHFSSLIHTIILATVIDYFIMLIDIIAFSFMSLSLLIRWLIFALLMIFTLIIDSIQYWWCFHFHSLFDYLLIFD